MLVKNEIWVKNEIFVKNRNFGKKSKIFRFVF